MALSYRLDDILDCAPDLNYRLDYVNLKWSCLKDALNAFFGHQQTFCHFNGHRNPVDSVGKDLP